MNIFLWSFCTFLKTVPMSTKDEKAFVNIWFKLIWNASTPFWMGPTLIWDTKVAYVTHWMNIDLSLKLLWFNAIELGQIQLLFTEVLRFTTMSCFLLNSLVYEYIRYILSKYYRTAMLFIWYV